MPICPFIGLSVYRRRPVPICPFIGLSVYRRRPVPICPFIGLSVYRRRPEKTGHATTLCWKTYRQVSNDFPSLKQKIYLCSQKTQHALRKFITFTVAAKSSKQCGLTTPIIAKVRSWWLKFNDLTKNLDRLFSFYNARLVFHIPRQNYVHEMRAKTRFPKFPQKEDTPNCLQCSLKGQAKMKTCFPNIPKFP